MQAIYLFSTSSHPDAISISSLEITLLKPEINFSNYDYFIITSKQALHALAQYPIEEYKKTKALCISNATANACKELGLKVLETGAGYGDSLIENIQKYPKPTRWLYLRAETIASDFSTKLKDEGYDIDEIVLYKSNCSKQIAKASIKNDATLIFTSPSTIKCFLKYHQFSYEHSIIVIGKTTAKNIPQNLSYKIAQEPTIQSCINLAKNK